MDGKSKCSGEPVAYVMSEDEVYEALYDVAVSHLDSNGINVIEPEILGPLIRVLAIAVNDEAGFAPQPAEPVKCPICYEDEPHTGTCGSSDPKALCNRAEPVKKPILPDLKNFPSGRAEPAAEKHGCHGGEGATLPAESVAVPHDVDDLAHEIWAAAQLVPGEGIEDGAGRIAALLARHGQPLVIEGRVSCSDIAKFSTDSEPLRLIDSQPTSDLPNVPDRNELIELLATLLHFIPKDEPKIYRDTERLCAALRDVTPPVDE